MIPPTGPARTRRASPARSQFAMEMLLTALAIVAALLSLRLLFRLLSVPTRVWSGEVLYALTDPLVAPLAMIPGGGRPVVGQASLADITAVALVMAIPLFVLSRPKRT